jgi:hypothetical protein
MLRKAAILVLASSLVLLAPASAMAAIPGVHLAGGSIFSSIGHAILGAFSWTVGLASKFLLTTLAGFVKLLIPQSWINQGLSVMEWIVAVPDYAGTVSTPGGGHEFGFAGINALRQLFMWLGVAVAPLTLTYATSRSLVDESEPIAAPLVRVMGLAVVVASYGYWWRQAAALADQVTHAILTLPDVSLGLDKLMTYAVGGVALGGWQLIDLGLMAAIGVELLGLIFLKVVLILCGALLYATGPLMIGLSATRGGHALARAWGSAVTLLFGIGIAWATLFAVGALLINDASTAGPLIAGNSAFGSLMGGLMLALAGLASLWLCLKVSREAAGLLRLQLAGAFSIGSSGRGSSGRSFEPATRTTARSLSQYGSRLAAATGAAGAEVGRALPAGAVVGSAGRSARQIGRRGLAGTAATAARAGARGVAPRIEKTLGRSRAGAVAVRAARSGAASWDTATRDRAAGGSKRGRPGTERARASATGTSPRDGNRPTSQRPDVSERPAAARANPQASTNSTRATAPPHIGQPRTTPSRSAAAHDNGVSSTTSNRPQRDPGPSAQRPRSQGHAKPSPRQPQAGADTGRSEGTQDKPIPRPATSSTRVSRRLRPASRAPRPGKGDR